MKGPKLQKEFHAPFCNKEKAVRSLMLQTAFLLLTRILLPELQSLDDDFFPWPRYGKNARCQTI